VQRQWVTGSKIFFLWHKSTGFLFLSRRNAERHGSRHAPGHHTPDFYIDDSMLVCGRKSILPFGIRLYHHENKHEQKDKFAKHLMNIL
jgi:hypothetical protein